MKSALIVIDAQNIYAREDSPLFVRGMPEWMANINALIQYFEKANLPVILVRHQHKRDGSDLGRMFDFTGDAEEPNFIEGTDDVRYVSDLRRPKNAIEIVKTRYSAFEKTDLDRVLRETGVDTIVICGFMTNYCCEGTTRDAHDRDYFVDFIMDATGCPDASDEVVQEKIKEVVAATLAGGYARVSDCATFIS
jgi:nicotinamidase-related amidase